MLRILRLIFINFAVLASAIVLLILGYQLVLYALDLFPSDKDLERASLPNYENADWALTHFDELRNLETTYFPFVAWRRELFAGETINIVGPYHERLTPQAENARDPEIFFFGGSTMWGTGARDQETIPAFVSRFTGQKTRNFGETGYVAHQGLEMLMWLLQNGEKPAAVVLYDGVNDVAFKCRTGRGTFIHSQDWRIRGLLSRRHSFIGNLLAVVKSELASQGNDESDEEQFDCDEDPQKARAVATALVRDWNLARMVSESEGIPFFAVLQPVVYFSDSPSDQRLNQGRRDKELREQFEAVYPHIKEMMKEVNAYDLTGVLDVQERFFIDFCHVSPNGNERIARSLSEILSPVTGAGG